MSKNDIKPQTTAGPVEQPALVMADPETLIIGANVRLNARLDKEFIESIRDRGVLVPVVGHRNADGELVVLYGQRRTLAAVQVGRKPIPVYVVATPDEADRLADQISENDRRRKLAVSERVAGFEQMAALGMSAGEIARRTAHKPETVNTALTVATSPLAKAATERYDWLTLDQAAVVAEFEADTEAVKALVAAAKSGGFDHLAQRLRNERAEAAERAAAIEALTAAGVRVLDVEPYYRPSPPVAEVSDLTHDGEQLTEDAHVSCPGHAAYLAHEWVFDDEDDEDDADPAAEGDEDEDSPSYRRAASEGRRAWVPVYVCADPEANGHVHRWRRGGHDSGSVRKRAADMTEEEREAARTARRDVINSNKAWVAAETVRRRWLTDFFARKTPPKGSIRFIAESLADADYALTEAFTCGHRLAHELLGIADKAPAYGRRSPALDELVAKASEARANMIALALLLAAYEDKTSRDSWRSVDQATARYLRFMEAQGYELSVVERRACGETLAEATRNGSDSAPDAA